MRYFVIRETLAELEERWAYPLVFGTCVLIITGSLIFFKKKKWL